MSTPEGTGSLRTSKRVMLGYTEDAAGLAALHLAVDEARIRHALLTIVHGLVGIERPPAFGVDAQTGSQRRAAMFNILKTVNEVAAGYEPVEVTIVTTPVANELVQASASASLIVLGVTTHHALTAAALDTIPREVIRRAKCPVMVVPAGTHSIFPRMVVCGTDRSPGSAAALHWAAEEADLRGVTVLAVDSRRHHPDELPLSDWVRRQQPVATTILCRSEPDRRPARRLVDDASSRGAMLVVGRHAAGGGRGSVSLQVSAQTSVPTVVVPNLIEKARRDRSQDSSVEGDSELHLVR